MEEKLYPKIFKRKSVPLFKDIGMISPEELYQIEKVFCKCTPLASMNIGALWFGRWPFYQLPESLDEVPLKAGWLFRGRALSL